MTIQSELQTIKEGINLIKSASGTKAKHKIISEIYQNPEKKIVIDMIAFINDKNIKTGISEKKFEKKVKSAKSNKDFSTMERYLEWLQESPSKKDTDIAIIQNFVKKYPEYQEVIKAITTKKLAIGIGAKGLNKAIGENIVEDFQPMLAKNYKDYKDKLDCDLAISLKMDGVRCIAQKKNGKVIFRTRQGKEILNMHLSIEIKDKLIEGITYDGELELEGDFPSSKERFKATQSLIAKKDVEKTGLIYTVFDALPTKSFIEDNYNVEYFKRKKTLDEVYLPVEKQSKFLKVVETLYIGRDEEKIQKLFNEVRKQQLEGLMANKVNGLYRRKRSDAILKIKDFNTIDLRIVDLLEGKNEFQGMLGAFVVEYRGNRVGVGSGISEEIRRNVWRHQEKFIGRVIEIKYFEKSVDKNGIDSLRFPVFENFRIDK